MRHIAERVEPIGNITTSIDEPTELSNHTPTLHIRWDTDKLGITTGHEPNRTRYTLVRWTSEMWKTIIQRL